MPGEPLSPEEKVELFRLLVQIGFREIEIGNPAASESDYEFCRLLVSRRLIPQEVTLQVQTGLSDPDIRRTFAALSGVRRFFLRFSCPVPENTDKAILSPAETEAAAAASLIRQYADAAGTASLIRHYAEEARQEGKRAGLVFCPEGFSQADPEAVLAVCHAVAEAWDPSEERGLIFSLESGGSAFSHVFASRVEYLYRHLGVKPGVLLSLRPGNARGCAVSDAQLGLLAGAQRVEGTLFGNGPGAGLADLTAVGLNLFTAGVDPKLDFSDLPHISEVYERITGMNVCERQPYSGRLALQVNAKYPAESAKAKYSAEPVKAKYSAEPAAAKNSAGQAAAKYSARPANAKCPAGQANAKYPSKPVKAELLTYSPGMRNLPIDPADIGRDGEAERMIGRGQPVRNSVNYILKAHYGMSLPENMREDADFAVKADTGRDPAELTPEQVYQIFEVHYISPKHVFQVIDCRFRQENGMVADLEISHADRFQTVTGTGNGRLDAVSNAIRNYFNISYELRFYEEHSLTRGSSSKAVAYVGVISSGRRYWGVGIDHDIIRASIEALTAAVNQLEEIRNVLFARDRRMVEIMNYIQSNYLDVSLETLSERFYLSKPYLSKYIREKSGMTFGELVKRVRMDKAKTLLKSSSMTVENISLAVGYQNVEHFNRLFKKAVKMTPVQFRNSR